MKKLIYVLGVLTFGIFTSSAAADSMMVRAGIVNSSGDATYEIVDGDYTSPEFDYDESGFEISLVGGVDTSEGFDFRPALTFQKIDTTIGLGSNDEDFASAMSLLGEFEFVYTINKYISPLVGFSGGLDYVDVDVENAEDGYGVQFGFFLGVSGEIYEGFGYYAKYAKVSKLTYFRDGDEDIIVDASITPIKFGISYMF